MRNSRTKRAHLSQVAPPPPLYDSPKPSPSKAPPSSPNPPFFLDVIPVDRAMTTDSWCVFFPPTNSFLQPHMARHLFGKTLPFSALNSPIAARFQSMSDLPPVLLYVPTDARTVGLPNYTSLFSLPLSCQPFFSTWKLPLGGD